MDITQIEIEMEKSVNKFKTISDSNVLRFENGDITVDEFLYENEIAHRILSAEIEMFNSIIYALTKLE